ncbi:hypothetical protein EVAR_98555_1 [Eumeta japonica]|uniref:Uncharacterized protein n=1 Tax=Eumeta variegata TaxID=151549 RepID=A0A4C1YMY1_EUMVA|nr:hypothetical protein EVAR_98555_1 [Eumeta japonica]
MNSCGVARGERHALASKPRFILRQRLKYEDWGARNDLLRVLHPRAGTPRCIIVGSRNREAERAAGGGAQHRTYLLFGVGRPPARKCAIIQRRIMEPFGSRDARRNAPAGAGRLWRPKTSRAKCALNSQAFIASRLVTRSEHIRSSYRFLCRGPLTRDLVTTIKWGGFLPENITKYNKDERKGVITQNAYYFIDSRPCEDNVTRCANVPVSCFWAEAGRGRGEGQTSPHIT